MMLYLAWVLAQPSAWTDFHPIDAPTVVSEVQPSENCSMAILMDVALAKGGGASYRKIDPDDKLGVRRLVGAYMSTQETLGSVNLKYVSAVVLTEIGIGFKQKSSENPDIEFGKTSHYDLQVLDFQKAFWLARALALTSIIFATREVASCVIESVSLGRISWAKLKPKLVQRLAIEGHLIARPQV
jgi:hypothetical protein